MALSLKSVYLQCADALNCLLIMLVICHYIHWYLLQWLVTHIRPYPFSIGQVGQNPIWIQFLMWRILSRSTFWFSKSHESPVKSVNKSIFSWFKLPFTVIKTNISGSTIPFLLVRWYHIFPFRNVPTFHFSATGCGCGEEPRSPRAAWRLWRMVTSSPRKRVASWRRGGED